MSESTIDPEASASRQPSSEQVQLLRSLVINEIQQNKPIVLNAGQLGDGYVEYFVYHTVLTRLCEEEAELKGKELHLRFWNTDLWNEKLLDLPSEVSQLTKGMYAETEGWVKKKMLDLASALGVKLKESDFMRVPEPHRYNKKPMESFDENQVRQQGEAIRQRIFRDGQYDKIIVITQGGSIREKRLTNDQLQDVLVATKSTYPKAYIVVVTDDLIKHGTNASYAKLPNEIVAVGDINRIGSYFYAMDKLISTDTFFAWYGCGARAMRSDRNGFIQPSDAIILYTVASPQIYQVPGSTAVESQALEYAKVNGKLPKDGLLNGYLYRKYARITYESSSSSMQPGINPKDVQKLLSEIERQ